MARFALRANRDSATIARCSPILTSVTELILLAERECSFFPNVGSTHAKMSTDARDRCPNPLVGLGNRALPKVQEPHSWDYRWCQSDRHVIPHPARRTEAACDVACKL